MRRRARRVCGWNFTIPGLFLKPGMFATVELNAEIEPSALLVPDSAVLRSGEKNTVFVALDNGHFEPRDVTLGPRAENNTYEVLSGLKEGERVVTSGQFMLDSESQLREAIQKMLNPNASPTPAARSCGSSTAANRKQLMPAGRTNADGVRLSDARARDDQIQPSRQMPNLRDDAYSRAE